MAAYGQQVVGAALGVAPRDLPDPGPEVAMRLVPLPDGIATDPAGALDLRTRIEQSLATEVAVSCWRGRGYLRLSAQVYNLAEEYERLAAGLARVLGDPRA
jgi:isopenicillin-N epimerase